MKKIHRLIVLIISLLLAFPPSVFAGTVGTITCIEGRVDRQAPDGEKYLPLIVGEKISIGDAVRTKSFSKAEVTFDDNSIVRIGDSSQIKVKDYLITEKGYRKSSTIALDRGTLRAIVSKTKDLAPFDVSTPNATGTVKGSDIYVSFQQSTTNVLVSEGMFTMANPAFPDEFIDVKPGMTSLVPYNAPPKNPRIFLPSEKNKFELDTALTVQKIDGAQKKGTSTKAVTVNVSGSVRVQSRGTQTWHVPSKNEELFAGDRIETGETGNIKIVFDSGLSMELRPNTQLIITILSRNLSTGDFVNTFESKYGKIVAKLQNKPATSTFQVKTPNACCGVRGTIMYLNILPSGTRTFFEGGEGFVADPSGGNIQIIPLGQTATANPDGSVTQTATTDAERSGFGSGAGSEGDGEYGYSGGDSDDNESDGDDGDDGDSSPPDTDGGDSNAPSDIFERQVARIIPVPFNIEWGEVEEGPKETSANFRGKFGYYGSFGIDGNSWIRGVVDTSANADPWETDELYPATFSGLLHNPSNRTLFFGELDGSTDDGGLLYGRLVGSGNGEHGAEATFSALYQDTTGAAGIVSHSMRAPGVYYEEMSDDLVLPDTFRNSIEERFFGSEFQCELLEQQGFVETESTTNRLNFDGETWGTWVGIYRGDYASGPVDPESIFMGWDGLGGRSIDLAEAPQLLFDTGENGTGYEITTVRGVDSLDGFLHMDFTGQYMDPYVIGEQYGTIVGTYNDNDIHNYTGVGAGAWAYTPLAWSATAEAYYHYYYEYYEEDGEGEYYEEYIDYYDEHFGVVGATTSPFESSGTPVDIFLMGEAYPEGYIIWWGHLERTEVGDGSVIPEGFIAGRTNSQEGLLVSLYIDDNGGAGTLSGDFEGTYYEEINMWTAEGLMTATQRATGHDAGEYDTNDNEIYGYFNGLFGGGGEIYCDYGIDEIGYGELGSYTAWLINPETGDPEPWGIYNLELGSVFDYWDTSDEWTVYLGGYSWRDLGDQEYWFATIEGSQWSDQRVAGTLSGFYLTPYVLGVIEGTVLGSYDTDDYETWEAIALGTFVEAPLTFSGYWGGDEGFGRGPASLYYNDDGYPEWAGEEYGLLGATSSPWDGPAQFVAIGEYYSWDEYDSLIWHTPVYSYNDDEGEYTTLDGGAFFGITAGTWAGGELEGAMAALYMDPDGGVGYFRSSAEGISGAYNSYLEMWMATGELVATPMELYPDMDPMDFIDNIYSEDIYELYFEGSFAGGEGYIEGYLEYGQTYFIDEEASFGIFEIQLGDGSYYEGRPAGATEWQAVSMMSEGEFYEIVELNGTWEDNGPDQSNRITADVSGIGISYEYLFTVEGSAFGVNLAFIDEGQDTSEGSWIASAVGVYRDAPLSYVSEIYSYEYESDPFNWMPDSFFNELNVVNYKSLSFGFEYDSYIEGLMGGVESLWSGIADVNLIGEFYVGDLRSNHTWRVPTYSINYYDEAYTTYDEGAFYGWILGSQRPGQMEGIMRALCVTPPDAEGNSNVGYLAGSFEGATYQSFEDFFMFAMTGDLETTIIGPASDIEGIESPEDLYYFLEEFTNDGLLMGGGAAAEYDQNNELNVSIFGMMSGDSLSFGDAGWGIWESRFGGWFDGTIGDNWILDVAGQISNPDNFFDEGRSPSITNTYYAGSIYGSEWTPEGRIAGEFNGIWLSHGQNEGQEEPSLTCGTVTGDIVGHNDYIEGGEAFEGSWDAVGAGEWVEVADLIDLVDLTSEIEDMSDFVAIPITEVLQGIGFGGIGGATMNLALYGQDAALSGLWAALINGTYGEVNPNAWGVDLSGGLGNLVSVDGVTWGDNQWTANVDGSVDGMLLDGTASGTYGDGDFSGTGTGIWVDEGLANEVGESVDVN